MNGGLGTPLGDILQRYDHRATDPETSVAAAQRNRTERQRQRDHVLQNIVCAWRRGEIGCTDFEHGTIQQTSAGVRRKELERLGFVEKSAVRRPTPSGSMAIVWKPTPEGVKQWGPK